MTDEEKIQMFHNRLSKVYRHLSKQAKRQGIDCYRLYDRDLPEFPLIIDKYDDKIYLSEYRAKHSLSEEQYESWLNKSLEVIATVTNVPDENIYLKQRKRKTGRQDQYQKCQKAQSPKDHRNNHDPFCGFGQTTKGSRFRHHRPIGITDIAQCRPRRHQRCRDVHPCQRHANTQHSDGQDIA